MSLIKDAFEAVSDGYPPDRIIADPTMNDQYIQECRKLGIEESVAEVNQRLLNLRKQGLLGRKGRKRTTFSDTDEYRFAAEMAIRYLERLHGLTLDNILCDPERAAEFDRLCQEIAPGFTSLKYRWAAFGLRKSKKLSPEILARVQKPKNVMRWEVPSLDLEKIPTHPGLYLFFTPQEVLYIGEAENLKARIKKHLDHSDRKELARWIWEFGKERLHLEVQVLDQKIKSRIRRALELELIRSRNPSFNIQR